MKWAKPERPVTEGLNDVAALVLKALPGVREPNQILQGLPFKEAGQNQLPGVPHGYNRP